MKNVAQKVQPSLLARTDDPASLLLADYLPLYETELGAAYVCDSQEALVS
ncbi:MAG: hypothetical protein ACKO15_01590 [Burkholderiales bacterium]